MICVVGCSGGGGERDSSGRLFVVEQTGLVRLLDVASGTIDLTPVLDVTASITTGGERGLLGFTTAPDFESSGLIYVNVTNLEGDTEIRRYQLSQSDPIQADPASEDVILTIAQFAENHNGGWIGFGFDDLLYIATGDGGGAGDPASNGQDSSTLLGSILRIDPSVDDFPNDPNRDYGIPASNPFSNAGGAPEVFAIGFRNPYRASFDRSTGDLYIGDVGQDDVEEIGRIPNALPGLNFGWNILEGNSVTGGVVYRGPIEELQGNYIFADFDTNNIWSINVDALDLASQPTIVAADFQIRTQEFAPDVGSFDGLTSFGEDSAGNLYLTDIDGEVFLLEVD